MPDVSIVIIAYNIARELPRTLHSFSADYQRHIAKDSCEVIVVDNGSDPPVDLDLISGQTGNFRLIRIDQASHSPARAINTGLAAARGDVICVLIDGARLVTPGFIHFGNFATRMYPRAVTISLGWYLGLDLQQWAIECHYNQEREDAMLGSIDWPRDGYRLFEIATLDEPSVSSCFGDILESNGLFLSRATWDALGGVDERFDAPGGGLILYDTTRRACELPGAEIVVMLGEGTFHQLHGGIATNHSHHTFPEIFSSWCEQYVQMRGNAPPPKPASDRTYLGRLPPEALVRFVQNIVEPTRGPSPLGSSFDQALWTINPALRPSDPITAALVDLAKAESRARRFTAAVGVARLARMRSPDELAPQQLLAALAGWGSIYPGVPRKLHADYHVARGRAFGLIGDTQSAETEFRAALAIEANLLSTQAGLSKLSLPGDNFKVWLRCLHELLKPRFYLEIGIDEESTLALARSPTCAISIDPKPRSAIPLTAETHIFCESSDVFFDRDALPALLRDQPLDLALIKGGPVFTQSLRDFMNIERFCGSKSVVVLRHTIPFDEMTQGPVKQTEFSTGDVWKLVITLKHYRSDLDIFTIYTGRRALTFVTGLNSASRTLQQRYAEVLEHFGAMSYADFERERDSNLNPTANDWEAIASRLGERRHSVRNPPP